MRIKRIVGAVSVLVILVLTLTGAYYINNSRCAIHGWQRNMCDFSCAWREAAMPYMIDGSIFYWSDEELLDFIINLALDIGWNEHVYIHRREIGGMPDFNIFLHTCFFSRGNCQPGTFYCNYYYND